MRSPLPPASLSKTSPAARTNTASPHPSKPAQDWGSGATAVHSSEDPSRTTSSNFAGATQQHKACERVTTSCNQGMNGSHVEYSARQSSSLAAFTPAATSEIDCLDFSDLDLELDALSLNAASCIATSSVGRKGAAKSNQQTADAMLPAQKVTAQVVSLGPELPEFWITAVPEPAAKGAKPEQVGHVQDLIREYQDAEGSLHVEESSMVCNSPKRIPCDS